MDVHRFGRLDEPTRGKGETVGQVVKQPPTKRVAPERESECCRQARKGQGGSSEPKLVDGQVEANARSSARVTLHMFSLVILTTVPATSDTEHWERGKEKMNGTEGRLAHDNAPE